MPGENKDWDSKVILFKIETTEGTDAGPTSLLNALQVMNFQPTFMDADGKTRNIEKGYFGANPQTMTAFKRGARFEMEMRGAGTATGIPPWMVPIRVAGFGVPVVGASSVVQSPITAAIPSGTMWSYIDDLLLKALGGRATAGFRIEDDDYPVFTFDYMGAPPPSLADQAVPTAAVYTGYDAEPIIASNENTTFTLDGYAVGLRRWEMGSGTDLQYRSLIGRQDRTNYRNRAWRGTVLIEIPNLTTKNYFDKIRPGTKMVASATHGIAAGNIVGIACPALQISGNVEISEEQGKAMASIPVTALPVAGNDEVVFTTS